MILYIDTFRKIIHKATPHHEAVQIRADFCSEFAKTAAFIDNKPSFFEQKTGQKDAEDDAAGMVRHCLDYEDVGHGTVP